MKTLAEEIVGIFSRGYEEYPGESIFKAIQAIAARIDALEARLNVVVLK